LTAAVESNGFLSRGFGIVSVQKITTGAYFLTFDREVAECIWVATIGSPGDVSASKPGEITVNGIFNTPNAIGVATYDSAGVPEDRAFHVAVHCRPQ
jgi:hypothetical protein